MRILGIETSCDETAAAIIEGKSIDEPVRVLSSMVASSEELHKKTGGIVPEVAARKQVEVMIPIIEENIKSISGSKPVDAIAVTVGPGLVGSLLIGVETARALSFIWEKPLLPVNHLVAHLYASWIRVGNNEKEVMSNVEVPEFPAVGLVVSGGHTDLVLMEGHNKLKHLGGTRDDAAGEAFDKIARMLGLGYPGGPAIEKAAKKLHNSNFKSMELPRPMINSEDFDFSFSGLKTAVLRQVAKGEKVDEVVQEMAYEVQEAICEVLAFKLKRATEKYQPKSVLVAGGVAANLRLRRKLELSISNLQFPISLFIPPPKLCTDNAAYIGACAFYLYNPLDWKKVAVKPNMQVID